MNTPTPQAFLARVRSSLEDNSFILLRIRSPREKQVEIRLVLLQAACALSFNTRDQLKNFTKNFTVGAGLVELSHLLVPGSSAWLETTSKNFQLVLPLQGRARLVEHRATPGRAAPSREHDRAKKSHLEDAADWLAALGLTDVRGRPATGRGDKLRQIERYADLIVHFAADCGWRSGDKVMLADMGCGKGYLTFAAWHVLRRECRIDATVIGVDAKPELVTACQEVAAQVAAENITFRAGRIEDAELPPLDALIALHACNDATDHALRRGATAGAKLIVVSPCCHKDVRRALGNPDPLAPLLEHGLFKERFAEWLTDGLRVLALEAAGYRVTTAEFVAAEHTPKNLLIGAVRGNSEKRRHDAAAQLAAIKTWAGLGPLPLDTIV